jgi:site-specific DNA recombinase
MLKHRFNPLKSLLVVLYLRMSSDDQNPRSPQQQRDTIKATLQRMGYPWIIVNAYTDEAISGRYLRRRVGFQKMLGDIRTGTIKADAILVDTFERFGRADELAALRQELYQHLWFPMPMPASFFSTTSGQCPTADTKAGLL